MINLTCRSLFLIKVVDLLPLECKGAHSIIDILPVHVELSRGNNRIHV